MYLNARKFLRVVRIRLVHIPHVDEFVFELLHGPHLAAHISPFN